MTNTFPDHEAAVGKSVAHLSRLGFTFTVLGLYLLLTVGAMDDTSLLSRGSTVQLPVFGISVSAVVFSMVAPILLVGMHVYLLLERYMLARRLRASLSWRSGIATYMPSFLFRGFQGGAVLGRWDRGVELLAGTAFAFMVYLPAVIVLILLYRFIAYHGWLLTLGQFSVLVADLLFVRFLLLATRRELMSGIEKRLLPRRSVRPALPRLALAIGVGAVVVGMVPVVVVFTGIYAATQLRAAMEAVSWFDSLDLGESMREGELYSVPPGRRRVARLDSFERHARDAMNVTARAWSAERLDLRGRDLRFADLSNSELRSADLRGADLRGAHLEGCNLQGARLGPLKLSGRLRATRLNGANLREANLSGADLRGANLSDVVLAGADLTGAVLEGARLDGLLAESARFVGADLRNSSMVNADLLSADARAADFLGADLLFARLTGAKLDFARMTVLVEGADFRGASLLGVIGLSLRGVDARKAVVDDSLMAANIWLSDVRGVKVAGPSTATAREEVLAELEHVLAGSSLRSRVSDLRKRISNDEVVRQCIPVRQFVLGREELHWSAGCDSSRPIGESIDPDFFREELAALLVSLGSVSDYAYRGLRARADLERQPGDRFLSRRIAELEKDVRESPARGPRPRATPGG